MVNSAFAHSESSALSYDISYDDGVEEAITALLALIADGLHYEDLNSLRQ